MPRSRNHVQWKCRDCGDTKFNMFMVKDEVWKEIWPGYVDEMREISDPKLRHGVLCKPCCEKRLCRPLTDKDMEDDGEFWIDPAGVSDSWAGELLLNANLDERLRELHARHRAAIHEVYFRFQRESENVYGLDRNDRDNMARVFALGVPVKTIAKLFHAAEASVQVWIKSSLNDRALAREVEPIAKKHKVTLLLQ